MNQPNPPSHGKVYYIKDGNRIKWFTREEYRKFLDKKMKHLHNKTQ